MYIYVVAASPEDAMNKFLDPKKYNGNPLFGYGAWERACEDLEEYGFRHSKIYELDIPLRAVKDKLPSVHGELTLK